jgi:hypothetical protein
MRCIRLLFAMIVSSGNRRVKPQNVVVFEGTFKNARVCAGCFEVSLEVVVSGLTHGRLGRLDVTK